jgi:HAD superfamily hydrolase (TIGR01662 family)
MFRKIKWLFFDIGSTLVDESRAYESRLRDAAKLANVTYEYVYETAIRFYQENKKGDLEAIKLLGIEKPNWRSEDEILYGDAEECLRKLSGRYNIGVIANQPLGVAKRLEEFGISKYIKLVAASAEEGVAKPDRRIFELALNRAGCEPGQSVMIGDRIDNDIVPAKKLGMHTIWVKQGFGRYWSVTNEEEKADYEVKSLMEICGIMKANGTASIINVQ